MRVSRKGFPDRRVPTRRAPRNASPNPLPKPAPPPTSNPPAFSTPTPNGDIPYFLANRDSHGRRRLGGVSRRGARARERRKTDAACDRPLTKRRGTTVALPPSIERVDEAKEKCMADEEVLEGE